MLIVTSIFKGVTINKKMCLDHELLRCPETDTLKYHEYIAVGRLKRSFIALSISSESRKNSEKKA